MKQELRLMLQKLTEAEHIELTHCMDLARSVRNMMRAHKLSDKELAKKMRVPPGRFFQFKTGTHAFRLSDIALIQCTNVRLGWDAWQKDLENAKILKYTHKDEVGKVDGKINISYEEKRKKAAKKKK